MSGKIPFGNLAAEVEEIRSEIEAAIARVLKRGWFILGEEVEQFEKAFAAYLGAGHSVGCGNGTDAITLALLAAGFGPGDEVITVANTCVPTAAGIRAAGCELGLADCDPATLQMDVTSLQRAITPRTKAVIPVHLFGSSPDMPAISNLCSERDLLLIEDCAQAHGAVVAGRPAGTWGVMSTWSFYPSKNLGAYGDGGAVVTNDPALAEKLRGLRNYGQRVRYHHDFEGRNSRLDEMQAAILLVKLKHLDRWNEKRRRLADEYTHAFARTAVRVPATVTGSKSARHLYPVLVSKDIRDAVRTDLARLGIETQIHYPVPIHRQKAYSSMFAQASFPVADRACAELLTLPLFPQMALDHARTVSEALVRVLSQPTDNSTPSRALA